MRTQPVHDTDADLSMELPEVSKTQHWMGKEVVLTQLINLYLPEAQTDFC